MTDDLGKRVRHEATSKEVGMLEQGSHASERYQLLMEVDGKLKELRAEVAQLTVERDGAWEERDQYLESNVKLVAEIKQLRRDLAIWKRNGGDILLLAEIARLTGQISDILAHDGCACEALCLPVMRADIERLTREQLHWEHQNGLLEADIERLKALYGRCIDALIWCSGSADFGRAGQAHKAWQRLVKPLLDDFCEPKLEQLKAAAPEGFVIVPKEPTEAMKTAWQLLPHTGPKWLDEFWGAMLAAARAVEPQAMTRELEPHAYVPSAMHMGDCYVCGHLQGDVIHCIPEPTA